MWYLPRRAARRHQRLRRGLRPQQGLAPHRRRDLSVAWFGERERSARSVRHFAGRPLAGCAFDDGTMSHELFEHFA